ncbi:hypothetical protein [Salarchaeum japonicum]|uniref:Uncharacterized protein n=1 Tax=Salarchaeum japonicum TaxID=555573 RepID=A0AAV3SYT0_9EURY|nr:hypothetical protein [Salarchaeum japonicum]
MSPPITRSWSFAALGVVGSVASVVFNLGVTVFLMGVVLVLGGILLAVAQRQGASPLIIVALRSGLFLGVAAVTFWRWVETGSEPLGLLTGVLVAIAVLLPLRIRNRTLAESLISASFGVLVVYGVLQQAWLLAAVSAIVTVVLARQTIQQRRERAE